MSKVIIFGGAGFIGSHYARFFKSNFPELRVELYDIETSDFSSFLDVRKPIDIDAGSEDLIINLSAVHRTPGHPDKDYFETNIRGAENVCAFAEKNRIKKILFTSSIAPYGASEDEKREDTLPTPNTPYGISKLVAEHIHKEWASKHPDNKLLILRPGVVFGNGEKGNFTRLASAIGKGIFFYPGRKDTIKGCIYVKDLVALSWKLFTERNEKAEIYNFTYSPAPSIETIVDDISGLLNKKKTKLVVSGHLLKLLAFLLQVFGAKRFGIHPDRVKKLMISTNISGSKLKESVMDYPFGLKKGLEDWYNDCGNSGLY